MPSYLPSKPYAFLALKGSACNIAIKRSILLLGLVLPAIHMHSTPNKDSLRVVIESNAHDTLRLNAVLMLTNDIENQDDLKFIAIGRELALRNVGKTGKHAYNFKDALDQLCINEAWAHNSIYSEANTALQMNHNCINSWQSKGENEAMAQALNNLGIFHYYLGNLDSSLQYMSQALDLRRSLPDRASFAKSLVNFGYISYRSGMIAASLPYFLEAIDELEVLNDLDGLLYALRMLGLVYVDLNENEKLLELAQKRLPIAKQYGEIVEIGSSYNAMAVAWNVMSERDSAKYYYEACIALIPLLSERDRRQGFQWWSNYATFLQDVGEYDRAIEVINEAAEVIKTTSNKESITRLAEVKSLVYNKKNMPDSAIVYGNIMMNEAKHTGRWDLMETAAQRLHTAYAAKGEYGQAYHYLRIEKQYADSLFNKENTRQLERTALTHQFNKAQAETKAEQARRDTLAAAELQHQRTLKNIGFVIGALVLLLAFGLYRRYRFKQRVAEELEAKNAEIDAARERAERSEAFRKQFLANMSHEIRTPMNAILGMSRLLKDREHEPQSQRYLDAIDHAANNLLVVINDILDLSKLEAGKMEARLHPAPLHEELLMVETTFSQRAVEKGLHFDMQLGETLPAFVHTDMARITQVLYNLLGNAIKFTEKGTVTLGVKHEKLDADQVLLAFAVSDTGPGIATEQQEQIFESFGQGHSQDNRRHGGTGLGLTIARSMVELLGGELQLESALGEGATFSFNITCALSTAEAHQAYLAQHSFQLSERHRNYPLRILLADDNAYNRLVANDTLHKYMPQVHIDTAATGQEVLDMLPQMDYDLVFMDVQMPGMDGYAATKAIRAHDDERMRNIHIVAFTASVIRTDIQRCYDAGMNGYIAKPFRDEDLLKPMAALIDKLPDRAAPEPHLQKAKNEATEAGQNLFIKLVPQRLEKLKNAIEAKDADAAKRMVHLMKAQLLDAGMTEYSEVFEWFEYLDPLNPKPKWMRKAEAIVRAVKKELKRQKSSMANEN